MMSLKEAPWTGNLKQQSILGMRYAEERCLKLARTVRPGICQPQRHLMNKGILSAARETSLRGAPILLLDDRVSCPSLPLEASYPGAI